MLCVVGYDLLKNGTLNVELGDMRMTFRYTLLITKCVN